MQGIVGDMQKIMLDGHKAQNNFFYQNVQLQTVFFSVSGLELTVKTICIYFIQLASRDTYLFLKKNPLLILLHFFLNYIITRCKFLKKSQKLILPLRLHSQYS